MAIIRLRLSQMDPKTLEAAAWNLGCLALVGDAPRGDLPFCGAGHRLGLCLTAAVSFDEFIVAWFVSGLNKTVPVVILEILQAMSIRRSTPSAPSCS
jgi:spermidine/putrescine transport system permease protein